MKATSAQADGINLHGNIKGALVHDVYIENTGDDTLALWGAESFPEQITFANAVAVNPGIMRPNWYGNCVATYGLRSVIFANITCEAPTLEQPIPQPGGGEVNIDTSMFVFYTSFGGSYPSGNSIYIKGWNFKNLQGTGYTVQEGSLNTFKPGKMVWTKAENGILAPFYLPDKKQEVNVIACEGLKDEC
ncbi:unnamed protein product [Durusdinium trenchii]|uniref:Uncharacterized protein n=1 Tax=Durusdinium trenchii TaxID=1381693 RepID=A0ABP0Q6S8_9DINO